MISHEVSPEGFKERIILHFNRSFFFENMAIILDLIAF